MLLLVQLRGRLEEGILSAFEHVTCLQAVIIHIG